MLESVNVQCPYCGEAFEALIDFSAGEQDYYEDCFVCCRPILFSLHEDMDGRLSVDVRRDDE